MVSFDLDEKYTKTETTIKPKKYETNYTRVPPKEGDWVEIYLDYSQDLNEVEIQACGEIGDKTFLAMRKAKLGTI